MGRFSHRIFNYKVLCEAFHDIVIGRASECGGVINVPAKFTDDEIGSDYDQVDEWLDAMCFRKITVGEVSFTWFEEASSHHSNGVSEHTVVPSWWVLENIYTGYQIKRSSMRRPAIDMLAKILVPESITVYRKPKNSNSLPKDDDLYMIEAVSLGQVKIGRSKDVERRLRQLQTGSPVKLKLVFHLPGMGHLENIAHNTLSRFRSIGEWFEGTPSDIISELSQKLKI